MKPVDRQFLDETTRIVWDHMHDPKFSVEHLSALAGYSRSQIHRKLRTLTGLTVSLFIREKRLQQAARWLTEKPMTINEIAQAAGFKSASYFRKCFKNEYGMTPSEYIEEN